jgi:hypothetical protein
MQSIPSSLEFAMRLHHKIYKGFINLTPQVENLVHRMTSYGRMYISINVDALRYGYVRIDEVTTIALTIELSCLKAFILDSTKNKLNTITNPQWKFQDYRKVRESNKWN